MDNPDFWILLEYHEENKIDWIEVQTLYDMFEVGGSTCGFKEFEIGGANNVNWGYIFVAEDQKTIKGYKHSDRAPETFWF